MMTAHQPQPLFFPAGLNDRQREKYDVMGSVQRATFDAMTDPEKIAFLAPEKMGTATPMAWATRPRPVPNRTRTLAEVVKKMISLQLAADFAAQRDTAPDPVRVTYEAMLPRVKGLLTSGALIGHAETDNGKFQIAPEEWDDDRFNAALRHRATITVSIEPGNGLHKVTDSGEAAVRFDDMAELAQLDDDGDDRPGDEMVQLATAYCFEVPMKQLTAAPTFYDREIERAFNYGPSAYAAKSKSAAADQTAPEPEPLAVPTRPELETAPMAQAAPTVPALGEAQVKRGRGAPGVWNHDQIRDLGQRALKGELGPVPPSLRNLALVVAQQYSDLQGQTAEDVVETFRRYRFLGKMLKDHNNRLVGNN